MRVPRSVLAVGGVVAAAALIGFMKPATVHALTAALVQVANTATNPVVSSEVSRTAAQTVALCIGQDVTGARTPFEEVLPGGGFGGSAYVVPDGESLMITEIDIQPQAGGKFRLLPVTTGLGGGSLEQFFEVPGDGLTHQFLFPNGLAWPSGQNIPYSVDTGIGEVCMRGYLTRS